MSPLAVPIDHAPLLEHCFLFDAVEANYEITGITGHVPDWLRGSYYVNGPARFERAGRRYRHWLDGDGMICRLCFSDDGIGFTSRFVRTRKWSEEESAEQFLYRGFGTAFPGDRLRRGVMLEPPVNVSVYPFDNRLLAFGEQTMPVELDPETLQTRGEYDFQGSINEVSPFAAHAKFDPANGHLLNFGISFSASSPTVNVYEFDRSGHRLHRRRFQFDSQRSIHDFGLTVSRTVFFLSPLVMDFNRFWKDGVSVMESLSWEPERGSLIFVAPRGAGPESPFSVGVGTGYCLHLINCFEEGSLLTVDVLEFEAPVYSEYQPVPDLFSTVAPCRPVRYLVDTDRQCLTGCTNLAYDRSPDFPSIDPMLAGHRYYDFWMLGISSSGEPGRKFFNQLAHGSWRHGRVGDVYQASRGEYLAGEPVYVGNPEERAEGVVIVQHLMPEDRAAEFLLFDAFAIAAGPIARLPLRHPVHPGFHASFLADC